MDTEEMYRRGVADAEQGELHPFYYQHYYHYRRGYDQTRRRLRQPLPWRRSSGRQALFLTMAMVLIVGGTIGFILRGRPQSSTTAMTLATARPTRIMTAAPTRSPIFPTATAAPTPAILQAGSIAVVSDSVTSLRARRDPGLKSPVQASFRRGEQVKILEGPIQADGYTWWRIEGPNGSGWSAEQSLDGAVWLLPHTP